jgi:hypothetical protein
MEDKERRVHKKPYEKPSVVKLSREQAKLKLMGFAMMGSVPAKELLELLFGQDYPIEKRPYEKPTVTELSREQAKIKLLGRAMMGDKEAKELLDVLFEEEDPCKGKEHGKKSA